MFYLTENNTRRALPETATAQEMFRLGAPRRRNGEGLEFHNGGDVAVLCDADGATLARWQFDIR